MTGFIAEPEPTPTRRTRLRDQRERGLPRNCGDLRQVGCLWGPHLEFILMENDYRITHGEPHLILPRGKFTPWYRLGSAFRGAPNWIRPSINVPRQLAGEQRQRYYEPHVPGGLRERRALGLLLVAGRRPRDASAGNGPDVLKDRIGFIDAHRDLYEQAVPMNDLAIVYLDGRSCAGRRCTRSTWPSHRRSRSSGTSSTSSSSGTETTRTTSTPLRSSATGPSSCPRPRPRRGADGCPRGIRAGRRRARGVLGEPDRGRPRSARGGDDAPRLLARVPGRGPRPDLGRDGAVRRLAIESSDPTVDVVRWTLGDRWSSTCSTTATTPRPTRSARRPTSGSRFRGRAARRPAGCSPSAARASSRPPDDGRPIVDVPRVDPYAVLVLEKEAE